MPGDILIVDDEADIRAAIAGILVDEGYAAREAGDADSALAQAAVRRPHLALLDIWLRDSPLDGLGLLKELRTRDPELSVIMISGHGTIETAVQAIHMGAYDFIEKPFAAERMLLAVGRALEHRRLRRELRELRERADAAADMIGVSLPMKSVRQTIGRVAGTGSRVLITGPPGCGKEIAARLVHRLSPRAEAPFVAINAAVLAPERFEAELFGAEDSAAGGARKIGLLEQAHGGTLLLDEVADMPLETQGKILRVLQDQTFRRVNGNRAISVDVRVIASTSRDLAAEIHAKRFREDLYYRLNVVPLRVPSLAERRDDIPALVRHFVERASATHGLAPRVIGDDAIAVLQTCDWPGNIRQLRNVVDWVLIMAPGEADASVRAEMLPPDLLTAAPSGVGEHDGAEVMGLPLRKAREVFEREYLRAQVVRFGHNISRTASFVGMERSALHRKLKSLGISGKDKGW